MAPSSLPTVRAVSSRSMLRSRRSGHEPPHANEDLGELAGGANINKKVLAATGVPLFRINLDASEKPAVIGGSMVAGYFNKVRLRRGPGNPDGDSSVSSRARC